MYVQAFRTLINPLDFHFVNMYNDSDDHTHPLCKYTVNWFLCHKIYVSSCLIIESKVAHTRTLDLTCSFSFELYSIECRCEYCPMTTKLVGDSIVYQGYSRHMTKDCQVCILVPFVPLFSPIPTNTSKQGQYPLTLGKIASLPAMRIWEDPTMRRYPAKQASYIVSESFGQK